MVKNNKSKLVVWDIYSTRKSARINVGMRNKYKKGKLVLKKFVMVD